VNIRRNARHAIEHLYYSHVVM